MYKRQVAVSLVLTFVVVMFAAVVANLDPFGTNETWSNWTALAVLGVVGVFGSLVLAIGLQNENESDAVYFGAFAAFGASYAIVGALVTGMMINDSIQSVYHSLSWASYAMGLTCFILGGMVNYLAADASASAARSNLRQVA